MNTTTQAAPTRMGWIIVDVNSKMSFQWPNTFAPTTTTIYYASRKRVERMSLDAVQAMHPTRTLTLQRVS